MSDINNLVIAYIGGGSMNFGWKFISDICQDKDLSGVVRLYDTDKKLSLANEVIGNNARELPESNTQMIFLAVDTLEEALNNADFVILSLAPGSLDAYINDIQLPESFNIYHAVGDNSGPGGIMRAMRILPEYINLAKKIKEFCPNAWVINLSEPMNACLKILYNTYPEIKAFGSSNDIFSTQELLADFCAEINNVDTIPRRDIKTNVIGVNKFTWINEATYNGDNLFKIYAKYATKYAETGYERKKSDNKSSQNISMHKVKFDLFLRYGMIAASSDKYLADSCPPWYLSSVKTAQSWKINRITAGYLKKQWSEHILKCRKMVNGEEYLKIGSSSTELITQIKALLGYYNIVTNVILKNEGQITNLPIGSIVETNGFISKNTIKPVFAGKIPDDIHVLMNRIVENNNQLVEAVELKNLDCVFNVFLNDPLICLDITKASDLFKKMLINNKDFISYYC